MSALRCCFCGDPQIEGLDFVKDKDRRVAIYRDCVIRCAEALSRGRVEPIFIVPEPYALAGLHQAREGAEP